LGFFVVPRKRVSVAMTRGLAVTIKVYECHYSFCGELWFAKKKQNTKNEQTAKHTLHHNSLTGVKYTKVTNKYK
jgi:predicted glycosyl hydrolase (DUF1957 family)